MKRYCRGRNRRASGAVLGAFVSAGVFRGEKFRGKRRILWGGLVETSAVLGGSTRRGIGEKRAKEVERGGAGGAKGR